MAYRMIHVGCGGFGEVWCRKFLPPYQRQGRIEVVAAVDTNHQALASAREGLGLSESQTFTDLALALRTTPADGCSVVVPPQSHEAVATLALEHGLHVLSEKPIADSLAAALRIAAKARKQKRKMGITFSHRFDQDKTSLRRLIHAQTYGPVDYLVFRSLTDNRRFGSWGKVRHEMENPILMEAAAHHFDIIADLAKSPCQRVFAQSWTPAWGEYDGHCQAHVMLQFENGVRAFYEGAKANAIGLNPVAHEYIRAECRDASVTLNYRDLEVFEYQPDASDRRRKEGSGKKLPLGEQGKWAHDWLIEQFLDWLDGGREMQSSLRRALDSAAINEAAMESSRSGRPVRLEKIWQKAYLEAGLTPDDVF